MSTRKTTQSRAGEPPTSAGAALSTRGTYPTAGWLSLVTAAVAEIAAGWTLADPGLLHGPPAMQGSARGTALVLGALAVPTMLLGRRASRSGSAAGVLVWAGALLYVVYNAVLFLFLTPFNAAFLVYVALLGTAVWSVGCLVTSPELWRPGVSMAVQAPARAIAWYVWVVVALNVLAWLGRIVPSLTVYPTPLLAGTGVATNAIYVQDLAIWLPLAAVAAQWVHGRQARGAVVVSAVLVMWVLEAVSIAVDQWFGAHADPTSDVVSTSLVAPFATLAVVGCVPVVVMLRAAGRLLKS